MNHQQIAQLMNRANTTLAYGLQIIMAKQEIVKRTPLNLLRTMWWKFMPGTTVNVKWPTGWTEADHLGNQTQSADPNDHFRPALEKIVGRQGWDWDWRLGPTTDGLDIKFRKGKEKYVSYFLMKWR